MQGGQVADMHLTLSQAPQLPSVYRISDSAYAWGRDIVWRTCSTCEGVLGELGLIDARRQRVVRRVVRQAECHRVLGALRQVHLPHGRHGHANGTAVAPCAAALMHMQEWTLFGWINKGMPETQ